MATTKADIAQWMEEGKTKGATHLIVVCDTFDWEDYPVFVYPKGEKPDDWSYDDLEAAKAHFDGPNMQKVMGVYPIQ